MTEGPMKIIKIFDNKTQTEYEIADAAARNGTAIADGAITPEKTSFGHILHKTSVNLYDSAGQTDDTISPHYYVNGVPSSTTQFDNSYHCTAKIEVEPSTAYWLGLVPAQGGYTKPWATLPTACFSTMRMGTISAGQRPIRLRRLPVRNIFGSITPFIRG